MLAVNKRGSNFCWANPLDRKSEGFQPGFRRGLGLQGFERVCLIFDFHSGLAAFSAEQEPALQITKKPFGLFLDPLRTAPVSLHPFLLAGAFCSLDSRKWFWAVSAVLRRRPRW